jgi:hypothetical protein
MVPEESRMARRAFVTVAVLVLALSAPLARAGMSLEPWRGHVTFGFARVFSDSLAPNGSLSVGAGIDFPIGSVWRLGPALSFNLLGSSTVTRGSVTAGLDYSLFEAALLATWLPPRGPFARLSFGPGVASPKADLSVAGGGAGFRDLTVGEVKPEMALEATLMSRHMPVVAVGAEIGARIVPSSQGTWTLLTARLAIHY